MIRAMASGSSSTDVGPGSVPTWLERANPYWATVVVFVLTMGISLLFTRTQYQIADANAEAELDQNMRLIGTQIIHDLEDYESSLQIVRGYVLASELVEQNDWMLFTEHASLTEDYPGCFGFSFVSKVPDREVEEYLRSMRREIPGFSLKQPFDADILDYTGDRYVIQYTAPESNYNTLGLDVSTKSINRQVYERAARTNAPALSQPMHLYQTGPEGWGVVLALPVYDRDAESLSPEERMGACIGWVSCPIGVDQFFEREWETRWDRYRISMYALGENGHETELFSTAGGVGNSSISPIELSFIIGGQPIALRVQPDFEYSGPLEQRAEMFSVFSITLSIVLTVIVFISSRTGARANAIAFDMTQSLRKKQAQHRALIERANAANIAKSGFLANMSHEIRTPLTAVLGYSEVLEDQLRSRAEDEELFRSIECIRRSGEHLRSIINDILDLSKIDAGKIDIQPAPCRVMDLVQEIVDSFRVRVRQKNLTLGIQVDPGLPVMLRIDGLRVRQVLINLIGNAVKFTDTGSVTLEIAYDGEAIEFGVRDSGVGIPPEMMGRLFRPFEQADNSVTRRHEGTGLGLSISQKIARLMHGEIVAESEPGVGSVFRFRFPASAEDDTAGVGLMNDRSVVREKGTQTTTPKSHGRVLLVEDGIDNQRLIAHFLRRAGFGVEFASNGKIAIETLARDCAFDVILMDMQMPVMDGYTTARLLCDQGNTIPIIALTAHVMEGDRERCIDAGCTDYLSKPIDRNAMISMIRSYAGPGTPGTNAA